MIAESEESSSEEKPKIVQKRKPSKDVLAKKPIKKIQNDSSS